MEINHYIRRQKEPKEDHDPLKLLLWSHNLVASVKSLENGEVQIPESSARGLRSKPPPRANQGVGEMGKHKKGSKRRRKMYKGAGRLRILASY